MISHKELKSFLPHRYPMLLVDSVIEHDNGTSIKAIKNITGTEACYEGVGKNGNHAYPQSLIIESFGQTGGIMYLVINKDQDYSDKVMFFGSITGMKFYGNAYPGDTLEHRVKVYKIIDDTLIITGNTWIKDKKIADIEQAVLGVRPASVMSEDEK
jgi:3-hydroxyacyl-[acyl-carrier-protein] dehydratase